MVIFFGFLGFSMLLLVVFFLGLTSLTKAPFGSFRDIFFSGLQGQILFFCETCWVVLFFSDFVLVFGVQRRGPRRWNMRFFRTAPAVPAASFAWYLGLFNKGSAKHRIFVAQVHAFKYVTTNPGVFSCFFLRFQRPAETLPAAKELCFKKLAP